jgi:hypothetical protein
MQLLPGRKGIGGDQPLDPKSMAHIRSSLKWPCMHSRTLGSRSNGPHPIRVPIPSEPLDPRPAHKIYLTEGLRSTYLQLEMRRKKIFYISDANNFFSTLLCSIHDSNLRIVHFLALSFRFLLVKCSFNGMLVPRSNFLLDDRFFGFSDKKRSC